MAKKNLVIKHDLSQLTPGELTQYLADVSEFIGLPPELNGLDTIFMDNEHGPGRSLVVYARRGTAEILRELQGINVDSLTYAEVKGSIVFTAVGKNKEGRQEIATGAKSISNLVGKTLDNAIKSASTQALRRLTMQFTKLGILDESEIEAVHNTAPNPAAGAELAGSPVVIPPAPAVVNNAPGKDVTPVQGPPIAEVYAEGAKALAAMPTPTSAKTSAIEQPAAPVTPASAPVAAAPEAAKEAAPARRPRARKNTVSMDVEPEVVNTPAPAPTAPLIPASVPVSAVVPPPAPPVAPQPAPAPAVPFAQAAAAAARVADGPVVPAAGTSVSNQGTGDPGFIGKPTDVQMADYRKRVSVYTNELPSSENMGSVQKMRAFITQMSGTAPQLMSTDQWEEMLAWFVSFVERNQGKGLVKYINDSLGVK
jgi:hypothetical protein